MTDEPTQWLIHQIQGQSSADSLWCCDENALDALPERFDWPNNPRVLSNRYDIAAEMQRRGLHCDFSDFDFSRIEPGSVDKLFYRVSKEKDLVHHIINQAANVLQPNGQLFLCGHKNEGIKTYTKKAAQRLGSQPDNRKNGSAYSAILTRGGTIEAPLDDSDYPRARPITDLDGLTLFSKPGLFGWKKVDEGSEFLMAQLHPLLETGQAFPESLLDLGCGYGYLALMTHGWPLKRRLLTDNNAAALAMAQQNCRENGLKAEIRAGDCGDTINDSFDLILCNPPFHQGFSVSGQMTEKFLRASHRMLKSPGTAVFVVNAFIPLERLAGEWFPKVRPVANNGRFKVIALSR